MQWLFPRTFWAQVMTGLLLVLIFLLPFKVGQVFWPSNPDNGVIKAVAILLGASTFVAMKATYMYFAMLLSMREIKEEKNRL